MTSQKQQKPRRDRILRDFYGVSRLVELKRIEYSRNTDKIGICGASAQIQHSQSVYDASTDAPL